MLLKYTADSGEIKTLSQISDNFYELINKRSFGYNETCSTGFYKGEQSPGNSRLGLSIIKQKSVFSFGAFCRIYILLRQAHLESVRFDS